MADGILTLDTDHSGAVRIKVSRIRSVVTEGPVIVRLADRSTLKGRLVKAGEGNVRVVLEGGEGLTIPWGQVDAINPPRKEPVRWRGTVSLAGNSQSGNNDRAGVSLGVDAQREGERDRYGLKFLWTYAEEDGIRTARNVYLALKYDYFFTPRVYGYLTIEMLSDEFRDLDLRTLSGTGLGWRAVQEKSFRLELELGLSYLNEAHDAAADERSSAGRAAVIFDWILREGVTMSDRLVAYHEFSDSGQQYRNEWKLAFAIGEGWSWAVQNVLERDTAPAAGVRESDVTWFVTLQFSF